MYWFSVRWTILRSCLTTPAPHALGVPWYSSLPPAGVLGLGSRTAWGFRTGLSGYSMMPMHMTTAWPGGADDALRERPRAYDHVLRRWHRADASCRIRHFPATDFTPPSYPIEPLDSSTSLSTVAVLR